jgi:hypothetical protein
LANFQAAGEREWALENDAYAPVQIVEIFGPEIEINCQPGHCDYRRYVLL